MNIKLIMDKINEIAECNFVAGRAEGLREKETSDEEIIMFRELSLQEMRSSRELQDEIRVLLEGKE